MFANQLRQSRQRWLGAPKHIAPSVPTALLSSRRKEAKSIPKTLLGHRPRKVEDRYKLDRERLEYVAKRLKMKSLEDWYNVAPHSGKLPKDARSLLQSTIKHYGNSLPNTLTVLYPHHKFDEFKFQTKAHITPESARQLAEEIAAKLNFTNLEDFYTISASQTDRLLSSSMKWRFRNLRTLVHLLRLAYPNHDWQPWKFNRRSLGRSMGAFYDALDGIRVSLNIQNLDDWYKIPARKWLSFGVSKIFGRAFPNIATVVELLSLAYPSHLFYPWRFFRLPKTWCTSFHNRRTYLEVLALNIGCRDYEDLYHFTDNDIKLAPFSIINTIGSCAITAIQEHFPEHKFLLWKFRNPPADLWDSIETQRAYFDWVLGQIITPTSGQRLSLDSWYNVDVRDVAIHFGWSLLTSRYDGSLINALSAVYPKKKWDAKKFRKTTQLSSDQTLAELVANYVSKKLKIKNLDSWYNVTRKHLLHKKVLFHVARFGGLYELLSLAYPQRTWNRNKFQDRQIVGHPSTKLHSALCQLFPFDEIMEKYHDESLVIGEFRGITLDYYLPARNLAIVLLDLHYYKDIAFPGQAEYMKAVDKVRYHLCKNAGISVVGIPYWWDGTSLELSMLINTALEKDILPVPETRDKPTPPPAFIDKSNCVSFDPKTKLLPDSQIVFNAASQLDRDDKH